MEETKAARYDIIKWAVKKSYFVGA